LSGWDDGSGVLVLDEPTAVLPSHEVDRLLEIIRGVQSRGASVLYVSHRLDEVFRIADRVTVLRDGVVVTTSDVNGLDTQGLAELMVGGEVDASYRANANVCPDAPVVLGVRGITGRFLSGVSVQVRAGEILGLAGLPGSGAEELPQILAGRTHDQIPDGEIRLDEPDGDWVPVSRVQHFGLPLAPADRARDGVVNEFSVGENISLSVLQELSSHGWLSPSKERRLVQDWIDRVQIKTSSVASSIRTLSGGNQQKVVLARCLTRSTKVLLLCEPTAGVDVGARQALYQLIAAQAERGLAVVVSSSDTGDLLALCNRVLVFARGHIVRELSGDEITEATLLHEIESGS
jgi:ribose transport system ATP-binding protein